LAYKRLELEMLIAKLMDERERTVGTTLTASARQEMRKGGLASDKRYQGAMRDVIDAQERAGYLNGVVSSWISRGYRLLDICKIADRVFTEDLTWKGKTSKIDEILEQGA
jgi:hypothetical protein